MAKASKTSKAPKTPKAPKGKDKPSILTYCKSMYITNAPFMSKVDGLEEPVRITTQTVLGTQSQYGSLNHIDGNIQTVETAYLPQDSDTLVIRWNMTITGDARKPHSCNNPTWRQALEKFAKEFPYYDTLGLCYAQAIARGGWAWRNQELASDFDITVQAAGQTFVFKAGTPVAKPDDTKAQENLSALGKLISSAFQNKGQLRLSVTGKLNMGNAAQVFPSQEFVNDSSDSTLSKALSRVPLRQEKDCAGFHEQKIGNALRTIDVWHGGNAVVSSEMPLPVEPYGITRSEYYAIRAENKNDLYSLLLKYFPESFENMPKEDALFIMACMIRGGVYGMKDKEKEEDKEQGKGIDKPEEETPNSETEDA